MRNERRMRTEPPRTQRLRVAPPEAERAETAPLPDASAEATEFRAMLDVLTLLGDQLRALVEIASAKLGAMRSADAAAIEAHVRAEEKALVAVAEIENRRRAILARLAQTLRCPDLTRQRLSALAALLPEPFSSAILAKSTALCAITHELERKNRQASLVARHLQEHLRAVFGAVAESNRDAVVYGADGQPELRTARNWVDAVG